MYIVERVKTYKNSELLVVLLLTPPPAVPTGSRCWARERSCAAVMANLKELKSHWQRRLLGPPEEPRVLLQHLLQRLKLN